MFYILDNIFIFAIIGVDKLFNNPKNKFPRYGGKRMITKIKTSEGYIIGYLVFIIMIIMLIYVIIITPPTFTIKKVKRDKFEFFTNYINFFGSMYMLGEIKHEMIPYAGAVEIVVLKDKRFVVYKIKESEITTKYAKDTAFVRRDYEQLYDDLFYEHKK